MKIKDIIRVAVIKTNPYWPFSYLNKIPYYLAIKVFIISCKKFPQIRSVYLRHGLTESNWVPGLSDIDLTVIFDSRLTSDQEYYFLKSFWKTFHSLKKFLPIIGEVDIIDDEEIDSWTKFTVRGYESRFWKLMYGDETVKSNYIGDQEKLALDSLNHAITNYTGQFLPKFFSNEKPKYLLSKELHRLAEKILKYSTKYDCKSNGNALAHRKFDSDTDMICCIIRVLEERVRNLTDGNKSLVKKQESRKSAYCNVFNVGKQTLDFTKLGSALGKIKVIYHSNQRSFIILEDELDDSDMKDCVQDIQNLLAGNNFKPIIIGNCTFDYIVRLYNPNIYDHLKKVRMVVFGADLFAKIAEPSHRYLTKNQLDQVINVLTYPQSYKLFTSVGDNLLSDTKMDLYLDRFLFLKLIIEKAIIKLGHKEILEESQKQYPNYCKAIDELKNNPDNNSNGSYSIEWFKLLRHMSNDIHQALSSSTAYENLFKNDQENKAINV